MHQLDQALEKGTLFGTGRKWKRPNEHAVLDEDWTITAVTRETRDRAVGQLGTSGSGNHFVEWGVLTLPAPEFGLEPGKYVALLSHSGSRGPGAMTCKRYTDIARRMAPAKIKNDSQLRHLMLARHGYPRRPRVLVGDEFDGAFCFGKPRSHSRQRDSTGGCSVISND